jgi:regulator of protease activity HflC (stomatin/prohibitin superfamily)
VDAGYVGVKTWFSAPEQDVLSPGIHFIVPIAESVHEVSIQPQLAQTQETASTNDQQDVTTTVSVNYQVDPSQAVAMYSKYRTTDNLEATIIAPIVSNDTKAVTANYNAQELLTKRGQVRAEIETAVHGDLAQYGVVIVTGVNITNFSYSDEYDQAIENKQVAQQNAQAEQYKLQQVQVSAQQQVAQAQAQAEAAVDIAKGQAQATVLQAQADAEAYTLKQKALTPLLVQQALVDKWNGVMPIYSSTVVPTNLLPALPAPAAPPP